jgi:hypothetical protein
MDGGKIEFIGTTMGSGAHVLKEFIETSPGVAPHLQYICCYPGEEPLEQDTVLPFLFGAGYSESLARCCPDDDSSTTGHGYRFPMALEVDLVIDPDARERALHTPAERSRSGYEL